jgi:hypothetical protein
MRRAVRACVELVLAGMSAVLALVTAFWPNWIESLFGASPDGAPARPNGGWSWPSRSSPRWRPSSPSATCERCGVPRIRWGPGSRS